MAEHCEGFTELRHDKRGGVSTDVVGFMDCLSSHEKPGLVIVAS